MLKFYLAVRNFLAEPVRRDDRGATAVEYGLIVTLIALAIVAAVTALGGKLVTAFQNAANAL
ncbi:MAG TPA: Flp family type IVb pilin [Streptosporangiaceae bacterium]|jgi:pilus assembly protein Flp/PilA